MASAAARNIAFKIAVQFDGREDGGLRAYSDDVPGFVLSNADCDAVIGGVVPVLETILSDMFNAPMSVRPLLEMSELKDGLEDAGLIPRTRAHATKEYVSQPAA